MVYFGGPARTGGNLTSLGSVTDLIDGLLGADRLRFGKIGHRKPISLAPRLGLLLEKELEFPSQFTQLIGYRSYAGQ
jgi:hypothetical protein